MVGVITTDVFKQVSVPLFTPVDKAITGIVLSFTTLTTLPLMLEAQPLTVLVTIKL